MDIDVEVDIDVDVDIQKDIAASGSYMVFFNVPIAEKKYTKVYDHLFDDFCQRLAPMPHAPRPTTHAPRLTPRAPRPMPRTHERNAKNVKNCVSNWQKNILEHFFEKLKQILGLPLESKWDDLAQTEFVPAGTVLAPSELLFSKVEEFSSNNQS